MQPLRNFLIFTLLLLFLLSFIFFTPAPSTWIEAQTWQIITLFTLILLIPTFFVNIFLHYLPKSLCIGLGILLTALQLALNQKSPLIYILITLLTTLLFFFIPKKSLTRSPKIPKITHVFKDSNNQVPKRRSRRLKRARLS